MSYQNVFKRYEYKYLITKQQREIILQEIEPYMKLDNYGLTTIRNIYYDTSNYLLIRNSLASPVYKEKLRIRSYEKADSDSTVFVELKKKYDSVVFKRRIALTQKQSINWIDRGYQCPKENQISKEIDYFLDFYKSLKSKAFISYERTAYYSKDKSDFRVTFDENILFRDSDMYLRSEIYGRNIIDENMVLMEIKCSNAITLWMVEILSKYRITKTTFSKYGMAYKKFIYPMISNKEGVNNV